MVEVRPKKVGIVACSGELRAEGTVTRLAALRVLEELRPDRTVTICLPLFLAGGEGDRAFARLFPTIAVDGCELRCALRGTEKYSGKPAKSLVVSEMAQELGLGTIDGRRRLNAAGQQAVEETAGRLAQLVDELLPGGKEAGRVAGMQAPKEDADPEIAPCACGSGIPVQQVMVGGVKTGILALPLILEQMQAAQRPAGEAAAQEILETVKVYNLVPPGSEAAYLQALDLAYRDTLRRQA
jgi:uncharacterized metal-binding protein